MPTNTPTRTAQVVLVRNGHLDRCTCTYCTCTRPRLRWWHRAYWVSAMRSGR